MKEKILEEIIKKCCRGDHIELISYYADRPDPYKIAKTAFIRSFNDIQLLWDKIFYFNIKDIECSDDYCFVITSDKDLSVFIIHNYSGFLENQKVIRLFSYLPESCCEAFGEYVIKKSDMSLEIKPYISYNNKRMDWTCLRNDYRFSTEVSDNTDNNEAFYKYTESSKRERLSIHKHRKK